MHIIEMFVLFLQSLLKLFSQNSTQFVVQEIQKDSGSDQAQDMEYRVQIPSETEPSESYGRERARPLFVRMEGDH